MPVNSQHLESFACPRWDALPDIDLYMDQVLVLTDKYFGIFAPKNESIVTSSMLNNYVKQKIVPPPDKKRYNKEHIARFLMICVLKRVFSMAQIKSLFDEMGKIYTVEKAYEIFRIGLDEGFSALVRGTPHQVCNAEEKDACALSLIFAVRSFAYMMFAEMYVQAQIPEQEKTT